MTYRSISARVRSVLARALSFFDSRRGLVVAVAFLAAISALLRGLHITFPPERIFDEVYSPAFAWKILQGEAFFDVHPLLAQLPHTLGLLLFGDTPFGWRFSAWLWGTLFIVGIGVLGSALTGRRLVGVLASLLATLDIAYFVYGRTGLPDMFLLMTAVWALAFFFLSCRATSRGRALLFALLSGMFFGNFVATKWFGIGGIALIGLWLLLASIRPEVLPLPKVSPWLYPVMFILVPVTTYLLWTVPLVGVPERIPALVGESFFEGGCAFGRQPATTAAPTSWLGRVVHWHCTVWNYHAHLTATHPYGSPWWSWPLLKHPVLFYLDSATKPERRISATGNPAIWWVSFALVWFTVLLLVVRINRRRPKNLSEALRAFTPDLIDLWLVIGVFLFWLPWAFITRVTFHYHYFLSFTFSLLLLARWLARLAERPTLRPLMVGYLGLVLVSFLALYPIATATRAPWLR